MDDAAALQRLEHLMTEFFSSNATNERIRTIEQSLHEFTSQINSWRPCLHFLSSTTNHYVSMFALTNLETTIGKRWAILPWEERALVRSTLYTLSLEHGIAPYVRNKIVKLVVDIAKHDWPHFYPDFFANILQLLGHKQTRLLGLIYLRTASEELATPREDLPIQRKTELIRLLGAQVATTLDTLTSLLTETTKAHARSGTVRPPPSPTGGQSVPPARSVLNVDGLAIGGNEICIATLEVLAHMFSWIIPTEHISQNLLDAIFSCARYSESMTGRQVDMVVQAMTTINELLYRPCSPNTTEFLLLQIFDHGVTLFQIMERLDSVDESYLEKTTEFLHLFVTNHLKRVESCPKFPVPTFLEVLYHHTFQQNSSISGYLRCLGVWSNLLESTQSRYSTVALAFAERVLNRMSFKLECRNLKDLDTENLDDNEETEWQHFLRCNIECLAKVADISPLPVFNLLYRSWSADLSVYGELGSAVSQSQMTILSDSDATTVHAHLRDLASTTQGLARLYSLFMGPQDSSSASPVDDLIHQTLDACTFAQNSQLFHPALQPPAIVLDLIQVHSQFLASLQAWCHWLAKQPEKSREAFTQRFVHSCTWALSPARSSSTPIPVNLVHSAAHLLQSITAILRPNLWEHQVFLELITTRHYPSMRSDTVKVMRRALVNGIVLAPGDIMIRQRLLSSMISTLGASLGGLGQQIPPEASVGAAMTPLKQLVEDCSSSSTSIKKLLHECLHETITRVLEILPHLVRSQVCEGLMNFIHAVFHVLQQQLGAEFSQRAVQGMLQIYSAESVNAGSGIDQLLEILVLVVAVPNAGFKAFVPGITGLCLGQVWPAVGGDLSAHPDTTLVLLRLFHSILMHRWQYFYGSGVLRSFGGLLEEQVEHKEELVAILEAFGQALLQPDVNIFRQSLQSLEALNSRWRLYQKEVFKSHLLERFLMALFTVLIHRSHNLLADEIAVAIHNLAGVDINWFFSHFLPTFLGGCEGLDAIQRATLMENFDKSTDQPTLTRSVLRLVSDLRCYQMCRAV